MLVWLNAVVVLRMLIWLETRRMFPYMQGTGKAAWWTNERLVCDQPCSLSVFGEASMVLLSGAGEI